jgi:hypothetical protein
MELQRLEREIGDRRLPLSQLEVAFRHALVREKGARVNSVVGRVLIVFLFWTLLLLWSLGAPEFLNGGALIIGLLSGVTLSVFASWRVLRMKTGEKVTILTGERIQTEKAFEAETARIRAIQERIADLRGKLAR